MIETIKIKKIFKNIYFFIASRAFESCLFIIFLSLLIGAVFFYRYNVFIQKQGIDSAGQTCPLEEKTYKKIMDRWQKEEEIFNQADSKTYYNMFSSEID